MALVEVRPEQFCPPPPSQSLLRQLPSPLSVASECDQLPRNLVRRVKKGKETPQSPLYPRLRKARRSVDSIVMNSKASLTLYVSKSKRHKEVATSYISTCALLANHNCIAPFPSRLAIADVSMDFDDLAPAKLRLLVTVTFPKVLTTKFLSLFNHV